jgi:tRNA acetyltransferase TAN1
LNLIVTCARHFEEETKEEIESILRELDDDSPQVLITEFSGILTADTSVNGADVVKKIREKLEEEPWSIRYTLRAIPVFATVKTDAKSISDAALEQIQKIKPSDTYRITIEKRNSDVSSSEIISQIADRMQNKVSLEKYDWIILVEVLGGITGVSILKDDDVLSVEKAKRKSFD